MTVRSHNQAGILQFRELKQAGNGDSLLVLYEANLDGEVFAYLYLRSKTCTLVWKGPHNFQFDYKLPFELIDTQFSNLSPEEIKLMERDVPKAGSSRLEHYSHPKCVGTFMLERERGLREYDLKDPHEQARFQAEFSRNASATANLAFARYDSEIKHQGRLISCSWTAERLDNSTGQDWELTVNLPRDLEFRNDALLRWIVKHHQLREVRKMNFEKSLLALTEMISPRTEPIYVFK